VTVHRSIAALAALAITAGVEELPPAQAPTPPPAGPTGEAPLREHAEDVADYTLRAMLDPAQHTVEASGTIHWRNASTRPTSELWVHLYLNAFKNDRSLFLRERVGGRGSSSPDAYGSIDLRRLALRDADGTTDLLPSLELHRPDDADETDARVALPRAVAPGEAIDLEVTFVDRLPSIVERTGYQDRFHMVGQWFPKIARLEPDGTWAHFPFHHLAEFYADFGTYDVTLDVPEAFTIGATGPVVESRVQSGRRVERHVQGDIHDFAWTAWDRWQSRHETIDGVDVTILYPRGFDDLAAREMAAVRFALPFDSAHYGKYPYPVLTIVHPEFDASEAGGMEYPTLITADSPWLTPPQLLYPEVVTVHELGHQWFYGLVATNEAAWPFLDEGVNEFAETDAMTRWRGPGSALQVGELQVSDADVQAVSSTQAVFDQPIAQPASAFSSGALYARLVYSRTAALLVTLGRVYGEDAVARALGSYTRRYRFEHPGPDEFLGAFRDAMGAPVADTMRIALFDKGWIDYAVENVHEHRAVLHRRGTLVMPVDVELVLADGTRRRETWDGTGDTKTIEVPSPATLRAVVVDPDHRITIDGNPENNFAAASGAGSATPRSLERALYWMELALQAVSP
jgi:hypothetical protein